MIKRYGFKYIGGGDYEWEGELPNGAYCKYDEYEELQAELTAERERSKKLKAALNDLLEQIDCLDGIEYTKDLEPYKAEAVWDDVLSRAQDVAKGDDHG